VAVPADLARDCSVDVTAGLDRWLASVPDGATAQLAGGCYRIDGTVTLQDRHDLIVDGGGATFSAVSPTGDLTTADQPSKAARTRSHWRLSGGSGITLRALTIQGANPSGGTAPDGYVEKLEAQHGIDIAGTQAVDIDHVAINDVFGDFVYFGPSPARNGQPAVFSGGRVHDSTMVRNGRQGIAITGGKGIQIDHNTIGDTRRATFDLEPNEGAGWGIDDVTITDNEIGPGRLNLVSMAGAGPVHDIRIVGNILHRAMTVDVRGSGTGTRSGLLIADNVADASWGSRSGAVIRVEGVDDVTVARNAQPLQEGRGNAGVSLTGVNGARVTGNSFVFAGEATEVRDGTTAVTSCGNQLVAGGAFDSDGPCPADAPPGTVGTVPPVTR
jgi:hypothetical protein